MKPEVVRRGERDGELAATAVDDEEIRKLPRLVFRAFGRAAPAREPSRQDLEHRGVVVAGPGRAYAIGPVVRLVGRTIEKRNHRADRVLASEMRDVGAFDATRKRRQAELR